MNVEKSSQLPPWEALHILVTHTAFKQISRVFDESPGTGWQLSWMGNACYVQPLEISATRNVLSKLDKWKLKRECALAQSQRSFHSSRILHVSFEEDTSRPLNIHFLNKGTRQFDFGTG